MLVLTLDDKNEVVITDNNGDEMTLLFNRKKGGQAVSVGFSEPDGQRNFNIARKKRAPFPAGGLRCQSLKY